MIWLTWIWEGLVSGALKIAALWWLVLLFVAIQILKDSGWLDKASRWMAPLLRPLRLPDSAGLPMAAGLVIGLTYGAGVLIQSAEEGNLSRDELTVLCIFLGICHAIIEETILFAAAGANGLLLLLTRFGSAALFGVLAARFMLPKPAPAGAALTQKGA